MRYRLDPLTLAENDLAGWRTPLEVPTQFHERIAPPRAATRRASIGITAVVMGSRDENLGFGLDLEAWVREGLIDTLMPFSSVAGGDSHVPSRIDPAAAVLFVRPAPGHVLQARAHLMPRNQPPEDYKRRPFFIGPAWKTFSFGIVSIGSILTPPGQPSSARAMLSYDWRHPAARRSTVPAAL